MRILIADDDQDIRLLLSKTLQKWGYEVILAADGAEAWDILQKEEIHFVITDWMMPGIDGVELCKRIRGGGFSHYIYIILLTAKDAKEELVEGMEAGADDFMAKPFQKNELNVRIKAGERIIKLEKDLEERNRMLSETNKNLSEAYSVIKKDLEAAAKIQSSLLPKPDSIIQRVRFDWLFLPSAFVAGDILNYFPLDEGHIGFYILDVAGHGIPAALLSVTLSRLLSLTDVQENTLKHFIPDPPYYEIKSPATVVRDLNRLFQTDEDNMQYFTMIYGVINTVSGGVSFTQAGHPHPICLQRGGKVSFIGEGGFPVGMLPDVDYEEQELHLSRGDRLILYSDGVTECFNNEKKQFTGKRLTELLEEGRNLPLRELLERIGRNLRLWKGDDRFEDDVTLLAMEIV